MAGYTPEQRALAFWAKVDKTFAEKGCWLWTGSRSSVSKYGTFNMDGSIIHAHRAAWILTNGPIDGPHIHVLHTCNNGALGCVNPAHMYLGTDRENTDDKLRAWRHCHGTQSFKAKLNDELVIAARTLRREGLTYREIHKRLGAPVSEGTLVNAVTGKKWKHIDRVCPPAPQTK